MFDRIIYIMSNRIAALSEGCELRQIYSVRRFFDILLEPSTAPKLWERKL